MGWNLPPGCTDKDVDEASPGYYEDDPQDYLDMRCEAMWVERAIHDIEVLCDEMCGKGYDGELRRLLNKIYREHWPFVRHFTGEDSE